MIRRVALASLICAGVLSFTRDSRSFAQSEPDARPCPSGALGRLFYFRQGQKDPSIFRLPLERPAEASSLAKTIFAITVGGKSIPLTLQRVFVRSPDPASQCAEHAPRGPDFGDEDYEIVSACERATAQYVADTTPEKDIGFLSHDSADKSRMYRVEEVDDPPLRGRIEHRLRMGQQHGLVPNQATAVMCQDKPRVRTFRFEGQGKSFAYYDSDCTGWGGDGTSGARFIALYREVGQALMPVFSTRRATSLDPEGYPMAAEFIGINPVFVSDLDGNGLIETRLRRDAGVSGDDYVVEFHQNGYKRLLPVSGGDEGMSPGTQFANLFLTCR